MENPRSSNRLETGRQVFCGPIAIGGGAPVSIQSMLNVDTCHVSLALEQIHRLEEAGCEIVRLAVPNEAAVEALGEIKKKSPLPLVADIHFDHRLALGAMKMGVDKIRINPGNIRGKQRIQAVAQEAKSRNIPLRIGVNGGSLERDLLEKYGGVSAEALVESALRNIELLDRYDFKDIVVSIKSSNVAMNTRAYQLLRKEGDWPLHIGVTEAGTVDSGIIKSAVGIGALLLQGIGDTIRVSLTGDPVAEVDVAKKILAATGHRKKPLEFVSCPTCGRTQVGLETIAEKLEKTLTPMGEEREKKGKRPLTVAVMGCEVNGPGEAREADLGVACGKGMGLIFIKGTKVKTVSEEEIAGEMIRLLETLD